MCVCVCILFSGLFLLYVHWCFTCIYVSVGVADLPKLELQTVVSYHVGAEN